MREFCRWLRAYIAASQRLAQAGETLKSRLLRPLRRHLYPRWNQIELRNGISIVTPREEPLLFLFQEIWLDHCYGPAVPANSAGQTIIDVGAHAGVFTVWAALSNPQARLIAVEPSPSMCRFLRRNVQANRLQNVTVLQSACGGQNGEMTLYSRGREIMNSLYARDLAGSRFCPLTRTPVLTLDELFRRFDVRSCAWLKLDCEGAEYEILMNAHLETLQRIRRVSLEYHIGLNDHAPEELTHCLQSAGFAVTQLPLFDEECGYLYAQAPA